MNIHGFTKTTLLDFPGHVAATIFTGNCNFRCPFCHNSELVLSPDIFPKEDEDNLLSFLKKRKGILSGVCITGGEPTLQPDLYDFLGKIKDLGYQIKLDTNGYRPDVVKSVIDNKLIDYIAMDIKSGRNNYAVATGISNLDISIIQKSIDLISMSNIDFEFRTTAVKNIHSNSDFEDIASWLPTDSAYFIQSYKETAGIGENTCESFTKEELTAFLNIVTRNIPNSNLRGID